MKPNILNAVRRVAFFAVPLIAAAAVAVVSASSSGGTTVTHVSSGQLKAGQPVAATASQLTYYQRTVGHPVYWIGRYTGYNYELTETSNHDTYIRYLPAGVRVGNSSTAFTTIGTYPSANAYKALLSQSKVKTMTVKPVSYKGIAVWSTKRPSSVYLAYPRLGYLIEVYDATPRRAQAIARSGEMQPVS